MKRLLALLLALAILPTAVSQPTEEELEQAFGETILEFTVEILGRSLVELPTLPGDASVSLRITDVSRDALPPPEMGVAGPGPQPHQYTFDAVPVVEDNGWKTAPIPAFYLTPGQERVVDIKFKALATAKLPYFSIDLNITATPLYCCASESQSIRLTAHTDGLATFSALPVEAFQQAGPNEFLTYGIQITNLGVNDKSYTIDVSNNACDLEVVSTSAFVPAGQTVIHNVFVETPSKKPFYFSELCSFSIIVFPSDDPGRILSVPLNAQIVGGYFDPAWLINFLWVAVPVTLLILFLLWRKRKVEEEILGKPQPPWTIPAEVIYLEELREKNPRAAYVVRNFLMEDEYKSSLAWYHAYKTATKGVRAKERLVVQQEHKLERWDAKQARMLAKPERKADKYAIKLQKKLDRKDRKAHRKASAKWRAACKKADAKNAKLYEKLHSAWVKQDSRAAKKGLERPVEPTLGTPDYAPEPLLVETDLGDHKWAAKALKFQDKMEHKHARMQAKSDRQRAKKLTKVRKKVGKIARKLDDPEFVESHPLLKA